MSYEKLGAELPLDFGRSQELYPETFGYHPNIGLAYEDPETKRLRVGTVQEFLDKCPHAAAFGPDITAAIIEQGAKIGIEQGVVDPKTLQVDEEAKKKFLITPQ